MGVRIKSERVHRLARQVAEASGTSMTAAIETALREKLELLDKQRDAQGGIVGVRAASQQPALPDEAQTSNHVRRST